MSFPSDWIFRYILELLDVLDYRYADGTASKDLIQPIRRTLLDLPLNMEVMLGHVDVRVAREVLDRLDVHTLCLELAEYV